MTTTGPITTPKAFQLGYYLALRDLKHTIETLIELVADVLEHVDSDTVYHSTKDHVEQTIRDARAAWRAARDKANLETS